MNTRMKPIVRRCLTWRGSSGLATLNATPVSAVRASMRSRRPAPAVVFHRWAVKSVLHGTVLSLSVTTLAFDFFFLPLTVALRMWMPTLVSFCGVIAAFQVLPRLALSFLPSSL